VKWKGGFLAGKKSSSTNRRVINDKQSIQSERRKKRENGETFSHWSRGVERRKTLPISSSWKARPFGERKRKLGEGVFGKKKRFAGEASSWRKVVVLKKRGEDALSKSEEKKQKKEERVKE